MNYIAEINSFYNWLTFHPLSPDAQALWHVLMQLNNRCAVMIDGKWYWRVEFTIPNDRLTSILSFSRQQLDRMRNSLIQAERIVYKKGKGSRSGKYSMIPFDAHIVTQYVTQTDTQYDTTSGREAETSRYKVWVLCNNMSTLINNNINNNHSKINFCDDDGGARVCENENANVEAVENIWLEFYHERPNKAIINILSNYLGRFPEELLRIAVEETAKENKGIDYLIGIMAKFHERKIRTEDDYWEYEFKRHRDLGRI